MFYPCSALTEAPKLPAKTLADYCYNEMFSYCTSLTTVPELPAESLAEYCYRDMFTGCKSLTNLPELPFFTSLATGCFNGMFQYCTSLTTAPVLEVYSLAENCFAGMFYNCTKLSSVKLFTDDPQIADSFNPQYYLQDWLYEAGTEADSPQLYLGGSIAAYYFSRSEELTNDYYYIPENWSVQSWQ